MRTQTDRNSPLRGLEAQLGSDFALQTSKVEGQHNLERRLATSLKHTADFEDSVGTKKVKYLIDMFISFAR